MAVAYCDVLLSSDVAVKVGLHCELALLKVQKSQISSSFDPKSCHLWYQHLM